MSIARSGLRDLMRGNRQFLFLWISQLLAATASGIGSVVKPIYLLDHASASAVGYYLSATTLSTLIALPVGGALADRFSRVLLIRASFVISAASSVLLLFSRSGGLPLVVGASFLSGCGGALSLPASRAVVADLVGLDRIEEAQSLVSATQSVPALVGPALAGFLLTVTPSGTILLGTMACSLVAACTTPFARGFERAPSAARQPLSLHGMKTAARAFLRVPWVAAGSAQTMLQIFFGFAPAVVLIRVVSEPRYGSASLGLILATSGTAALIGTVIAGRWKPSRPGLWSNVGFIAFAGYELCLAVHVPLWTFCAATIVGGIGIAWHGVWWYGAINRRFPAELRGRINSMDALAAKLLEPAGMALAIPLSGLIGVRTVALTGLSVFILAPLLTLLVPGFTRYSDGPSPDPAATPRTPESIGA